MNVRGNPGNNSQLLMSVLRQRYNNYKIFIYGQKGEYEDDSSEKFNDKVKKKMKRKVKFINEDIDSMKECKDFDVVLMLREG